jgi:hypothetical protein
MDYLLDGRIKINSEPEHKSLYSWSLSEIDSNGNILRDNQIPWNWSFFFIGSLLQVIRNVEFGDVLTEEGEKLDGKFVSQSDSILGQLHPGRCRDGKHLENATVFTMFNSNRKIDSFNLTIIPVESGNDETCRIEAIPSYPFELDFVDEVEPDYIGVRFYVARKIFEEMANSIERKLVDHAVVRLKGVSGIYSGWSPMISTPFAKILTGNHLDRIDGDNEIKSILPVMGDIEEFSIALIVNNQLNVKIDQRSVSFDKFFDDDADSYIAEESSHKIGSRDKRSMTEEIGMHLVLQIKELQKAISKINIAIWILVVIFVVQAFK